VQEGHPNVIPTLSGKAPTEFSAVADAFAAGFAGKPDMGAALCVLIDGEIVLDLWGGKADARNGRPWSQNTATPVFSCTKGLVSILAAHLVREKRLAYDDLVSTYWPAYAANGKENTTIAHLLAHRAGLPAPRRPFSKQDMIDWDRATELLAAEAPFWEPGTDYAYHAITHGWLIGEVIRRLTGQSVGTCFAERVGGPLAVDCWIGLPADRRDEVAYVTVSPELAAHWQVEARKPEPNWPMKALSLGGALPATLAAPGRGFNDPDIRAAEIPGAGGIASARALATVWSATVTQTKGLRLLDKDIISAATVPQSEGMPFFGGLPPYSRFGMGFQLDSEARRYIDKHGFGHGGAGGQLAFADPNRHLGFAYVTNWMGGPDDRRSADIVDALRGIVGG
jgi:CubicO group peptidase (beta-lactamase class C family)